MRRVQVYNWAFVLGCTAVALTAAALLAGRVPLFLDEAVTLNEALMPSVSDVVAVIQQWDPGKPPLYFLLMHEWLQVVAPNEFWLRFPSVVFGALCVPVMYTLGRLLFGTRIALVACLLLAVNPWFLWISAWARMYSLFILFTLATSYFLERLVREGSFGNLLGYAVSMAFLLYLHFFAGFVVIFHLCYVLLARRHSLPRVAPALALCGVAYLPWLRIACRQVAVPRDYSGVPTFWNLVGVFKHLAGSEVLAVLFAPLFVLGLVRSNLFVRHGTATPLRATQLADLTFPLVWLCVPIFLLFGINWTFKAMYSFHYLLFVLPAFLWITAAGAEQLPTRFGQRLTIPWLAVVVALSLVSLRGNRVFRRPDFRPAAHYVAAEKRAGDIVVVENPAWRLVYSFYDSTLPVFGVDVGLTEQLGHSTAGPFSDPDARTAWVVTAEPENSLTPVPPAAQFEMVRVYAFPHHLLNGERDRLAYGFP